MTVSEFKAIGNTYRTETQNHAKRIKDLIALAQDNRRRIDALLGKRTRGRSDVDDDLGDLPRIQRASFDYSDDDKSYRRRGSRGSDNRRSSSDSDRADRRTSHDDRDSNDRRGSRDGGRDRSDRGFGRDGDRDRSHGQSDGDRRKGSDQDSDHRARSDQDTVETTERITINAKSQGVIEVGGVTLTNRTLDVNGNAPSKTGAPQKVVQSNAAINMSPKFTKKPFKFGTVSLQVKLDDSE